MRTDPSAPLYGTAWLGQSGVSQLCAADALKPAMNGQRNLPWLLRPVQRIW